MAENKGDKEILDRVLKKAELVKWFEKNCLGARRVDPKDENTVSPGGDWQVIAITGPKQFDFFTAKTFLEAIEIAKGVLEGEK